jgi:hypothetical protein
MLAVGAVAGAGAIILTYCIGSIIDTIVGGGGGSDHNNSV